MGAFRPPRRFTLGLVVVLAALGMSTPAVAEPGALHAPHTAIARGAHLRWIDTPGWARAGLWSAESDDWEPAIAADPRRSWVYQAATRYGGVRACGRCPTVAIVVRASSDNGKTWGPDHFVCACPGVSGQFDPLLEVSGDGTVYAAWLNDFNPGVSFAMSADHGATWSDPVNFPTKWSDKPILGVSRDGRHIFLAFNGPTRGDIYVAQSHDGGQTFTTTRVERSERYFFDGGVFVSRDGREIAFAENDFNQTYTGEVGEDVLISHDRGHTWQTVRVDLTRRQPDCTSKGCYDGYYATVPAIGGDENGNLVFAYVGAVVPRGRQRMFVSRSTDGGLTWSSRRRLSPIGANAVSSAAVGAGNGDIRIWWMDDRTGRFNTWSSSSSDGGLTWSAAARISNAISGPPYVGRRGFLEVYGDYGEIAITNTGQTVATWGEGPSYYGPGGVWFNRQR